MEAEITWFVEQNFFAERFLLGFDNVIYMYKQARRNGYVEEISRFEI
jgi:hypothetical protein